MEIAIDSGTVILISILAIIDFIFFIIAYTIELPVKRAAEEIQEAQKEGLLDHPVQKTGIDFLDQLLDRFDQYKKKIAEKWIRINTLFQTLSRDDDPKGEGKGSYKRLLSDLNKNLNNLSLTREPFSKSLESISPVLIRPAVFIFIFSEALSISFLPVFAKSLYQPLMGLSREIVIGLPISAFMLFIAVALPIGGLLSDTVGKKKTFLTGAVISAMGLFLTGTAQDILILIVYRSLVGFGFGLVFMASQNYIIETTAIANRAEGLAMFISAFYGGTLCGSAIGGMLADRVGYSIIFSLGGTLSIVSVFFLYLFVKEKRDLQESGRMPFRSPDKTTRLNKALPAPRDLLKLFSDRDFTTLVALQSIPNKICLIGFVYYLAPLFLQELGNNRSETGRYIMGYSLAMILFSQIFSRWSDRNQKMKAGIFWGNALSGIVLIPFFFFQNTLMVVIGIVLLGLSHALSVSNQTKLASQLYAVRQVGLGAGLGLYRLAERVGNVVAPIIAGLLLSLIGFSKSLAVIGCYTLISSLLYLILARKRTYIRATFSDREAIPCRVDGKEVQLVDLSAGGLAFYGTGLKPGYIGHVTMSLLEYGPDLTAKIEILHTDQNNITRCRFKGLTMDMIEAIHAYIMNFMKRDT
jgi:MFS family permease